MFADKVNSHEIAIETKDEKIKEAIIEELTQIRQKDPEKEGKLQIVGKPEIIQNLGRSPDFADSLTMRMWFELTPKPSTSNPTRQSSGAKPYIEGIG